MARAVRIELTYTNRIHGVLSQMLRTNIDAEGRTRTSDTRIPLTLLLVLMLSTFFLSDALPTELPLHFLLHLPEKIVDCSPFREDYLTAFESCGNRTRKQKNSSFLKEHCCKCSPFNTP